MFFFKLKDENCTVAGEPVSKLTFASFYVTSSSDLRAAFNVYSLVLCLYDNRVK